MDRTSTTGPPHAETLTVEVSADEYIAIERQAADRNQPTETCASRLLSERLADDHRDDGQYFQIAYRITAVVFWIVIYAHILNQYHIAGAPGLFIDFASVTQFAVFVACGAYLLALIAETADLPSLKQVIPDSGGWL